MFHWDIRSVLLAVASFHAVVVSILLFIRYHRRTYLSDRLLAFFLISISATLSEQIAGWLKLYVGQGLTFFPFGEAFLFAPLAYLYVCSITNSEYRWQRKSWLHLIPAAIYFAVHFLVWFHPVPEKQLWIQWLAEKHWFELEGYGSVVVFSLYLFKTIYRYRAYLKWLPNEYANPEKYKLYWLGNFIVLLGLYYLIFLGFGITASYYGWLDYGIQFWQYLILAIIIYYISITGYAYVQKYAVAFDLDDQALSENPDNGLTLHFAPLSGLPKAFNALSPADDAQGTPQLLGSELADISIVKQKLLQHLQDNRPYLDAEITLSQLAAQLDKPPYLITQAIKSTTAKNFNDLINGYRVQAVIEKLKNGEHKTKTLLGIAYDCGFNSKATFNRVFKKAKNISPKAFVESL